MKTPHFRGVFFLTANSTARQSRSSSHSTLLEVEPRQSVGI
nr:MAG TPA: hypothetical protein [Caudoviricetes sp.]